MAGTTSQEDITMGILSSLTGSLGGTQQRGRGRSTPSSFGRPGLGQSGVGRTNGRSGASHGMLAALGGLALSQLARRAGGAAGRRGYAPTTRRGTPRGGGLLGSLLGGTTGRRTTRRGPLGF
ncbi:hypothetical protein LG274_06360 [Micrococcus antarcticus]|uniref:hypothetical protein n=1 Tax=Micrococcus antarcticus TaxID=86171 RepID=UPI00384A573D